MLTDSIGRALGKSAGELEGGNCEETICEGHVPDGVDMIVEVATDDKNHPAANLRLLL